MAFATTNRNAQPFITEKDLLRQVASNWTKATIVKQEHLDEK